jgi:hypothetical protein
MALLAEDVLLLLLDDETGRQTGWWQSQSLLGGALLSELALEQRVTLRDKTSRWHPRQVYADGPAPQDPLLAEAWTRVAEKPRTPQQLVNRLGKRLRDRLAAGLVTQGVLREERARWLGLVPVTRWPAASAVRDEAVRQRVSAALVLGQQPDPRTQALIALLSAADLAHRVVDSQRLPAREVRKRAKTLAEGDWVAKGVHDAIATTAAAAAG